MEVTTRINPPFPGNASGSDGALNKAAASMDTALNKASTGLHSAETRWLSRPTTRCATSSP